MVLAKRGKGPAIHHIIGVGEPDEKTAKLIELLKHKDKLERLNLPLGEFVSYTSGFFSKYLDDTGARLSLNKETAELAMKKQAFSHYMLDMLLYGRSLFDPAFKNNIIFRSGDFTSAGTGLNSSETIMEDFLPLMDECLFLKKAETSIKKVLASDFSEKTALFKDFKGIPREQNCGIIMMPYYAKFVAINKPLESGAFINIIGDGKGKYLVSAYIGGLVPSSMLTDKPSDALTDLSNRCFGIAGKCKGVQRYQDLASHGDYFNQQMNELFSISGPAYFELVKYDTSNPTNIIVQYHPINLPILAKPAFGQKDLLAKADMIIGTSSGVAKGANIVDSYPSDNDRAFNAENRGYLLFIDCLNLDYMKHLYLPEFSNAALVWINITSLSNKELHTHLNGIIRETGIPFILTKNADVKGKLNENGEYFFYADEFNRDGFVALAPREKDRKNFFQRLLG